MTGRPSGVANRHANFARASADNGNHCVKPTPPHALAASAISKILLAGLHQSGIMTLR
jgi:hypothetical protein